LYFKQNITNISSSLLVCLTIVVLTQAVPVGWFYFYMCNWPAAAQAAGVCEFLPAVLHLDHQCLSDGA